MKLRFSNIAFLSCALFMAIVMLVKPRYLEQYTNATLAWDVSGYYLYLPAIFIYDDLDKVEFLPEIIDKYMPSPSADQAYPAANGNMVMKYSAGMAVLYSPAFFLSHAFAKMSSYPADGFSLPYQVGIHWWSVFVAIVGLFFLKKILSKYFDDNTAGWVLILLVFGTNFLNYSTFDAANTHDYLFALVAILVWCSARFHESHCWKYAIGIGLSLGLAALTRPTEIIYAAIPVLWGVSNFEALKARIGDLFKHFPKILTAVILVGIIGSVQLVYWKSVSGNWLEYSYQDQGFSFLRPTLWMCFSPIGKDGWFIRRSWHWPFWGFHFCLKNIKTLPCHFPFPIDKYLDNLRLGYLVVWRSFGQRAFIQSYVLWAFPLAALVFWVKNKAPGLLKMAVVLFSAGCILLNVFQTYQAHWGPFETEAMTEAYYWRIFGKIENDPYDRLLLDAGEGYSGEKKNLELLVEEAFESMPDTALMSNEYARSGRWSMYTGAAQAFSPPVNVPKSETMLAGEWLSVNAWFFSPRMNWDYWRMPQLVVRFEKEEVPVKEHIIRPFRVMQPNAWTPVGMDVTLPDVAFDNVEIFLWNAAGIDVLMFMDDLRVEVFSGK